MQIEDAVLNTEIILQNSMPAEYYLVGIPEETVEEHKADIVKIAATIPECAMKCVVSMTPQACGHEYDPKSADFHCQCHAKEFAGAAASCVKKSCKGHLGSMISTFLLISSQSIAFCSRHLFRYNMLENDKSDTYSRG